VKDRFYLYWLASKQDLKIKQLESSRSWRYTSIFRRIFKIFRKFSKFSELKGNLASNNSSVNDVSGINVLKNPNLEKVKLVLFTHEFSRTGAPAVALELIKNSKYDSSEILVIGPRRGPLLIDFNKYANIFLYEDDLNLLAEFVQNHRLILKKAPIILNTLTLYDAAEILSKNEMKFITWAHELQSSWKIIGIDRVTSQILKSELIISDSQLLLQQITNFFKFPLNSLFIENGFYGEVVNDRDNVRKELGISDDEILLVIPGTRQIRKGYDLFPDFVEALKINLISNNVKIIWIGDSNDIELDVYIKSELSYYLKLGNVLILDNSPHYLDLLNASDAMVLLSREDSSPQVLSAGKELGLPVFQIETLKSIDKNSIYWRSTEIEKLKSKIESYINNFKSRQSTIIGEINTWDRTIEDIKLALHSLHIQNKSPNEVVKNFINDRDVKFIPVTAVVIFYNQEKFVKERLNSIVKQTVSANEVIIIDDFSTDNTKKEINDFVINCKSRNFKIISNPINKKIPTLNWLEGVLASENNIVWIIEGDDLSDPEFLERSYNAMQENGVDIVVLENILFFENLIDIKERKINFDDGSLSLFPLLYLKTLSEPKLTFGEIRNLSLNMGNPFYNVGQFIWKKETILNALVKSEHKLPLFCDYEVYLNISDNSNVYFLSQNLNFFRTHHDTIRAKTNEFDYIKQSLDIYERYILKSPAISRSNKIQYLINLLRLVSEDEVILNSIYDMMKDLKISVFEKSILYLNYYSGSKYIFRNSMNFLMQILSMEFKVFTLTLPISLSNTKITHIIEILSPELIVSDSTQYDISIGDYKIHQVKIIDSNFLVLHEEVQENTDLLLFIGTPEEFFLSGWPNKKVFFIPREIQFENIHNLSSHFGNYIKGL
jgi:glycosyltransferase involved in cell wall biosynthesis